jgi:hypothetical protein
MGEVACGGRMVVVVEFQHVGGDPTHVSFRLISSEPVL